MGKVLVLYHSASGNTAAMARLVAEGAGLIPGTEVRLREVDAATPDDVYWCDGLAVGSPTNMGVLSWKMKRFWDEAMFDHWGEGGRQGGVRVLVQRRVGRRGRDRLPVAPDGADELRVPGVRRHRLRRQDDHLPLRGDRRDGSRGKRR